MKKKPDQPSTWGRLLQYCRSHIPVILIAVISAAAGTILTLLGPDQLSELTDLITAGIVTGIDLDAVASIGFS